MAKDGYDRALRRMRFEDWKDYLTPKIQYQRGHWGHESNFVFRIFWFGPRLHNCVFDITRFKMYAKRRPLWRVRVFNLDLVNEIH